MDLLSVAREKLRIAESDTPNRLAYIDVADHIAAWLARDPSRTQKQAAEGVGKSVRWVKVLLHWRKGQFKMPLPPFNVKPATPPPVPPAVKSSAKRTLREAPAEVAPEIAKALEDPEVAESVVRQMTPKAADRVSVIEAKVATERITAKNAEHSSVPKKVTVSDLTDVSATSEAMSESWTDDYLFAISRACHRATGQVRRYGVNMQSVSLEEALRIAEEAEREIAEIRAALQEQVQDAVAS